MSSFFRYPGGKSKFKDVILQEINRVAKKTEYREPFFGGGSIGLNVIESNLFESYWINDIDIGVYSLWKSVLDYPEQLKEKVLSYTPTVEDFDKFKAFFVNYETGNLVDIGFMKLALHQISYSGLGPKSGGPLGGRNQDENTKYPINCRWSPTYICKKIDAIHQKMKKLNIVVTSNDFEDIISSENKLSLLYLDPPYFDKGNQLYLNGFSVDDHVRLSTVLKNSNHEWVLSYDDCDEIRGLYSWANIKTIGANYTINTSTKKSELIITNF